jgi:hypothetical protein
LEAEQIKSKQLELEAEQKLEAALWENRGGELAEPWRRSKQRRDRERRTEVQNCKRKEEIRYSG